MLLKLREIEAHLDGRHSFGPPNRAIRGLADPAIRESLATL
jgi:hypothetical protein